MTWLLGIIIFIAGAAAGLIANRFLPFLSNQTQELTTELEQSQKAQESLKQELTDYLAQVESSFDKLATQAKQAAKAANDYNVRVKASDQPAEEIIPYFGDQVSEGLQQTKPVEQLSKQFETNDTGNAPRDYSEGNSGILVTENEK